MHIENDSIERNSMPFGYNKNADIVYMNGQKIPVYRHVNENHYASVTSDILRYTEDENATPFMTYASGNTAAVAHADQKGCIVAIGFPFECIKNANDRLFVMKNIINYMNNNESK